ncbi:MAG TPA: PLP-dependent aspartate aminotransferase family protein [Candidatus Blautia intestinavium]|nr:PLP-dependent aspartate aminotransferase family protein [Candidatus Blautia intestinavium]
MKEKLLSLTHSGETPEKYFHAVTPPVFLTSLHIYDRFEDYADADILKEDEYIYGRDANPTVSILERKIAELEHGSKALAFSSGMAACTAAIMATCRAGSHIICMKDVYQPVTHFLNCFCVPKLNMTVTYVSGNDLDEVEDAMKQKADLMILESPATFVFRVVDLKQIAKLAHRYEVKTYIDNTCMTPLFQNPLDYGIDIVMHTMSKYIGGHSDIIGGVLVSKDQELMDRIQTQMREWYGGILGPMEGWLAIRGLRTLYARMMQLQDTALKVAEFLEKNEKVVRVYYTGLESHPQRDIILKQQKGHTSLMSLILDATVEQSIKFLDDLKLFGKGCSWGGFESLALMPLYKATEEELTQRETKRQLIRLYCGLEGADNLIEDLEVALKKL